MDTPHVIKTHSKHLSWLLETHPVIQEPTHTVGDRRSSWAWVDPPVSIAELDTELAVEEERFRRYDGAYPRDPPPKSPEPNRRFSTITRATSALLDPEEIDWDGLDDQANPHNWINAKKWRITFVIILMTVNVTFASSSPSTATRFVAADFGVSQEVADLITMSLFIGAVFLGPVTGPIVSGFILESSLSWRWVFWVMMIFAGTCTVIMVFSPRDVCTRVTLQAKALRKADLVGNKNLFAAHEKQDWSINAVLTQTLFRPFKMLGVESILVLMTLYTSLIYGVLYGLFQAIPIIFVVKRDFTISHNGLIFVGVGIGTSLGAALNVYLERDYPALIKAWRGSPPPEERLRGAMVGGCAFIIGIFWLGWSGQYPSVPWYVPAISTIVVGMSVCMIFISCFSYLVETYLMYSASAFAANTFCRSLVAAAFPLFTVQFFTNLGVNWAATLLGGIGLLLVPSPFLFYKYGTRIRSNSKFAPCLDLKIAKVLAQEGAIRLERLGEGRGSAVEKVESV
ncbi:major facilitator superfamily domain-containing protein [Mycena galopus ATCC 62051]|nr:major facilitator superfamily domain-containing protein [Mycena galopus ATCC 62051]